MKHLRILMRARRQELRNRLAAQPAGRRLVSLGLLVLVAGGLLALGNAAAPGLRRPPADLATAIGMARDTPLPAGAGALEAAFWLAALAASVLNFRVMELLFRRPDVRALEQYPLKLYALFIDRILAAGGEALAAALIISPLFLPLLWQQGALAAVVSIALVTVGLLASTAIGFAVQLGMGTALADSDTSAAQTPRAERPNVSHGAAQVFLYAPGAALAASVIVILLAKLAFGEVLKAGAPTRAFSVGIGILALGFGAALLMAFRYFMRAFPAMTARFHEVDFVGYSVSASHQTSEFNRARLGERLLPQAARPIFRAYALQFGRRYMLTRWAYGLAWLVSAVALWRLSEAALPAWLIATLAPIAIATLINPWQRLSSPKIRPDYLRLIAVSQQLDTRAAATFALRETILFSAPYAILVLGIHGARHHVWALAAGLALLAVGGCIAINGAIALVWRLVGRTRLAEVAVPILLAIVFVALANLSLWALAGAQVVLALGHLAPLGAANTTPGTVQGLSQ